MSDPIKYESQVLIDERSLALDRLERMFQLYRENRTEVTDNIREAMAYSLINMINATTSYLTEAIDVDQSDS